MNGIDEYVDPPDQPGADILKQYKRTITQAEMDRDREAYLQILGDRHRGETIVCLGTGPSLAGLDLTRLDGVTTVGCNGIGHVYQPDYYIIADPFIYGLHRTVFLACPGLRILSSFTEGEFDLRLYYRREDLIGLARDRIYSADSTGYLCVSTAAVMGAKRILLAGYDGYAAPSGGFHCYPEYEVEADRVRYEWAPGNPKEALLRTAYSRAAEDAAALGIELRCITPSPLLDGIIPFTDLESLGHA